MTENQSIVKKTESAIDDLIDLWRRRRGICIIVLIIIVAPICFGLYLKFLEIPNLESKISGLEKDLDIATKERDKAEIRLAPFLAAAEHKFPKERPDKSLELLMDKLNEVATLEQQNKMLVMLERMVLIEKTNSNALIKEYPLGYILFANTYQNRIIPYDRPLTNFEYSINWDKSKILSIDIEAIRVSIRGIKLGNSYCDEIIFNIERNTLEPQPELHAGELLVYTQMLKDDTEGFICLLGLKKGKSIGGNIKSLGSKTTFSRCKPTLK